MIKRLIIQYKCNLCDSICSFPREVVIDELTKKLEFVLPAMLCSCGNSNKGKIKLINVFLEDGGIES